MRPTGAARRWTIFRQWWPLALLCLVGGSRWILSAALPGSSTTLASAALGCGSVAAICLLAFPLRRKVTKDVELGRSALGGALVIAGSLIVLLRPDHVSGAALTMAMALTPVVLAVAELAIEGRGGNLAGRLWPGLAAIAGLLLILPEPSLATAGNDLLLALAPLLTACGAVLFCRSGVTPWRLPTALLGGAGLLGCGAVALAAAHHPVWPQMLGLAAVMDAIEAWLAVLALGRLSAARWSAQFALIPLLVLLEGLALMRQRIPVRMIGGLLLLAAASVALLLPPAEEPQLGLRAQPGQERCSPYLK